MTINKQEKKEENFVNEVDMHETLKTKKRNN